MNPKAAIIPLLALATLSACGSRDKGEDGTSVSINAKDDGGGDVSIKADGSTGKVSLKVPGFDAKVNLPKIMLDGADFDLDGVKLYPDSKVRTINIDADDSQHKDSAKVNVAFDSPADVAKVKAWFKTGLADKKATFTETASGFTGKTADGDEFVIGLTANGAATQGTISVTAH